MSAPDDATLAHLARAFEAMGAPSEQARIMAAQLLKRARQIAEEKGIPEVEAMAGLLAKVAQGRQGTYTGEEPPVTPSPP